MIARIPIRCAWRAAFALIAFGAMSSAAPDGAGAQSVAALQGETELEQTQLDQILATGTFAVTRAEIAGGKLKITGTTKGKRRKVVLDGKFTTKSSSKRVFTFNVSYAPPDCIGGLAAEGKTLEVAVRNCGQTGPAGEQGRTGKRGPKGETGATGAKGPDGDPGPKGSKGATGDAGPAGADGPAGVSGFVVAATFGDADGGTVTSEDLVFIGDTVEVPLAANLPFVAGMRAMMSPTGSESEQFTVDLCIDKVPSVGVNALTNGVLLDENLGGATPVGQLAQFTVGEEGTYEIGLCVNALFESGTFQMDRYNGWIMQLLDQSGAPATAAAGNSSPTVQVGPMTAPTKIEAGAGS